MKTLLNNLDFLLRIILWIILLFVLIHTTNTFSYMATVCNAKGHCKQILVFDGDTSGRPHDQLLILGQ